jgi:hypothetical protein
MHLARKADDITADLIYSKIDDYDIYRYYMGDFKVGTAICNHHRGDKNPSFVIYAGESGHLFHRDYADENFRGGPFDLIGQIYAGLNYDGALKKVAHDFWIADSSSMDYKKITSKYVKPTIDMKRHALIQVSARKWDEKDLAYWLQYGIAQEQLRREDVYCVKEWSLNRRKQYIGPGELCFAYRYSEGFKVYYPFHPKDTKWFGNITINTVENLSVLKKATTVLITKAKKDRMCLQNLFPDLAILSVQNESRACFNEAFVSALAGKEVWINYDSDEAGVKNCKKITEEFGYNYINVPRQYLSDKIKDFSDLYKQEGSDPIFKYFKSKGLYVQ